MSKEYETAIYTREQLENARTKGQLIGWVQGAASIGALILLLNLLGWIPLLIVASLLGFGGYKYATRNKHK